MGVRHGRDIIVCIIFVVVLHILSSIPEMYTGVRDSLKLVLVWGGLFPIAYSSRSVKQMAV